MLAELYLTARAVVTGSAGAPHTDARTQAYLFTSAGGDPRYRLELTALERDDGDGAIVLLERVREVFAGVGMRPFAEV